MKQLKNYLCINGKKTELTEKQLKQLGFSVEPIAILTDGGKIAKVGDYEFIVLKNNGDTVELLLKDLLKSEKFGTDCDYKKSNVKKTIDKFQKEIETIVGADAFVEYTLDLTSDDGLKDYGEIKTKMSPLTCDMYRKHVEQIDEFKIDKWWWLVTPYSTPKHGYDEYVKCVSPGGGIGGSSYRGNSGVRPFCILKSNIFVSK